MERPDTTPLYIAIGDGKAIIQDETQRRLDAARTIYRKQYDRGYALSARGDSEKAQRILDNANTALRAAEAQYAEARGRYDHLSSSERCSECGQPDNCGDCDHA